MSHKPVQELLEKSVAGVKLVIEAYAFETLDAQPKKAGRRIEASGTVRP